MEEVAVAQLAIPLPTEMERQGREITAVPLLVLLHVQEAEAVQEQQARMEIRQVAAPAELARKIT